MRLDAVFAASACVPQPDPAVRYVSGVGPARARGQTPARPEAARTRNDAKPDAGPSRSGAETGPTGPGPSSRTRAGS
ncbi:hypothetical protein GCM10020295_77470 [Streptomyces cinereospinus]